MDQDSRTSFPDKRAFAAADKAVSIMGMRSPAAIT
jgi:hypothetical protein